MKYVAALLLVISIVAGGCRSDPLRPPPHEQFIQLRRSAPVRVIFENATSREVRVLPSPGSIAPPKAMGPGQRLPLVFMVGEVAKLSDMNPGDSGWLVAREGAGLLLLDAAADHDYLDMNALRARVRVDAGDPAPWNYHIELGDCVFSREVSTSITIEHRPRAVDPPARLCEDGAY